MTHLVSPWNKSPISNEYKSFVLYCSVLVLTKNVRQNVNKATSTSKWSRIKKMRYKVEELFRFFALRCNILHMFRSCAFVLELCSLHSLRSDAMYHSKGQNSLSIASIHTKNVRSRRALFPPCFSFLFLVFRMQHQHCCLFMHCVQCAHKLGSCL